MQSAGRRADRKRLGGFIDMPGQQSNYLKVVDERHLNGSN